jgi:hypothetical protein
VVWNHGGGKSFLSFPESADRLWGINSRGVGLTRLLLWPRLRKIGAITPLFFYTFMAHLGTHFAFMF